MPCSEEVLRNDQFSLELDQANFKLAIQINEINKSSVYIIYIQSFIRACDEVAQILLKFNKTEKLLHFNLWARNRLCRIFFKECTGLGVRIWCKKEADTLDETIKSLCFNYCDSKVTPLLKELIYLNEQKNTRMQ